MRLERICFAVVIVVVVVAGAGASGALAIELDDSAIYIEINDTDGDAGIQLFLDGEGWRSMKVFNPDGRQVLKVRAKGSIGVQGITEFFFESAEPSFDEQPLDEFLGLFPPGTYTFVGRTTEGEDLTGEAELTHDIPAAPVLVRPVEDAEVDPEDTVIEWQAVAAPPGSRIVRYQVVVEKDEGTLRVFSVDIRPSVTSVTVPPEFMQPGTAYKFEVIVTEESGNQTISEREFETE